MIVVTKTFHRVFTSVFFVHCWQHETIQVPALPGWHIEKCRCTYHSLKSVEEIVGEDHQSAPALPEPYKTTYPPTLHVHYSN